MSLAPTLVRPRERVRAGARGPAGLVGPLLLVLAFGFFIPTALLLLISFYTYRNGQIVAQVTLANYLRVFGDRYELRMLARTFVLGAETGVLAVLIGYPVAHFLVRSRSWARGLLMTVTFMPLLASVVVRSYSWLVILGDHGLVNTTLRALGIVHHSVSLIYNSTGVLIGLTHAVVPYAVLAIMTSLQGIDPILERAAGNLGAPPVRAFLGITLPLSLPGVAAGFLLAFAATISSYVIPQTLGGGFIATTGTEIYDQMLQQLDWPLGATIAAVVLVAVLASLLLITRLQRRSTTGVAL